MKLKFYIPTDINQIFKVGRLNNLSREEVKSLMQFVDYRFKVTCLSIKEIF